MLILCLILAKKFHPDAIKGEQKDPASKTAEAELEKKEKVFKEITEAYSVIGDIELRKKYDRLIFGSSSMNETSSSFDNQDAYQYWQ